MTLEFGKVALLTFGSLLIIITLIPLIRKTNWFFRVFEYPRAQKLILNVVTLVIYPSVFGVEERYEVIFTVLLSMNMVYLLYQVWPYTVLARVQLKRHKAVRTNTTQFSLFIFNVYQDNKSIDKCLLEISKSNPDIILLVEVDDHWKKGLDKGLHNDYPYQVSKPLDNTYGMVLYSRFELVEPKIKYLIKDQVPSIHTNVRLKNGDCFRLFGLHPQPPVPSENPRSAERDAEILLVAREAKQSKIPVIVAGDLNDVAWSYTTELFLKTSKLLDARRGRGFYNTFNANYFFLRWPLDHVFCSTHFELIELRRLPNLGSDHFPIFISLSLVPQHAEANKAQTLHADSHEKKLAAEKIRTVKQQQ